MTHLPLKALDRHLTQIAATGMMMAFACQATILEVSNPGRAREAAVVEFNWPNALSSTETYVLVEKSNENNKTIPLQVGANGKATFILPSIQAEETKEFTILQTDSKGPSAHGVKSKKEDKAIRFETSQRPVLRYQAEPDELPRPDINPLFRRGAYLHPVHSPSGLQVSDDFPPNHIHHHGIWFPWTHTQFQGRKPDFWNMGQGTGRVDFVDVNAIWDGPVYAGFESTHRFVDLSAEQPMTVLNEKWEVKVYSVPNAAPPYHLFDLTSVHTCATDSPLVLPEYRYGGMGFRGNRSWNGKDNCFFLTSNGQTDRIKGHATRANWCHIGGQIDGQWTGLAILSHPENFRSPQPMRIHPTEPFFNFAPQQAGDMSIEPGEPYISRYRYVVFDGKPDAAWIEKFWEDYSRPLSVKVVD